MEEFWSLNEHVFYCLYDPRRARAFKRAIFNTVRKGDVVVDLGAGTGVLSLFAAGAGAKKIYAVESDLGCVANLRETVRLNGLETRITVIEGDAACIDLPAKVDVVICEMIATGLLEESQIPVMNNVQRFIKSAGRVLIAEYDIFADLVDNKNTFHRKRFYCVRFEFPDKPSLRSLPLTERRLVRKVDFSGPILDARIDACLRFEAVREGTINGLRLSGGTTFYDGSTFQGSVSYSFPMILPTPPLPIREGDALEVELQYELCGGPRSLKYQVRKL